MKIQNSSQLTTAPLREQALRIAEAGYAAIDTEYVISQSVQYDPVSTRLTVQRQSFVLNQYKKITCIGFGKAAFAAVKALRQQLGAMIQCGFVIDLVGGELENITCKIGTHPFPTEVNVAATQELLALVEHSDPEDLVIFVVSGGGSSLLCYPNEISCDFEVGMIHELTKQGATIHELNTMRKHVSKVKGGNLAKICYPATVISLIFSDVPGNDLTAIASGPTVKDSTTIADAETVLKKYNVLALCGADACPLVETPKEDKYFEKVHNIVLVSPEHIVEAMKQAAEGLGWPTTVYSTHFQGDAQVVARDIIKTGQSRSCLVGAGETTVQVRGQGLEGRCQVMALTALSEVSDGQVFVPLASDGQDHSDAAGAIADMYTKGKGDAHALDAQAYLANNDSYHYFQTTGDLVFTGKTGSNVSDFFVLLTK